MACGTRTIIDAVSGPTDTGEITYPHGPARSPHAGMILLLDRNFAARDLIGTLTATGAEVGWCAARTIHAGHDESPRGRR